LLSSSEKLGLMRMRHFYKFKHKNILDIQSLKIIYGNNIWMYMTKDWGYSYKLHFKDE
jgi:hypothetical protein